MPGAILAQRVAEKGVAIVSKERLLPAIVTLCDMMGDAGNDNARETSHSCRVAARRLGAN